MTFEDSIDEDWSDAINEETLMMHALKGSTAEARLILSLVDREGNLWCAERVVKFKLKKAGKIARRPKK